MNPFFISRGKNGFLKKFLTFFRFLKPCDLLFSLLFPQHICTLLRVCPEIGRICRFSRFPRPNSSVFLFRVQILQYFRGILMHTRPCVPIFREKKRLFRTLFRHATASCPHAVRPPQHLVRKSLRTSPLRSLRIHRKAG